MNRSKKIAIIFLVVVIVIVGCVGWQIWRSSNCLVVNEYECNTGKLNEEMKVVVLSDLHEHEFGAKNDQLVELVKVQKPDIILLLGDFVNNYSENADVTCELIRKLKAAAPIYFAIGNHEIEYMQNGKSELISQLEEAGAVVLDKAYEDVVVDGNEIRIGGLYEYAFGFTPDENLASAAPEDIKRFLEEFQDTDMLKIMMSHRPDSFIFGDACDYWDVDLVVSGYNHGGQVVLPGLGGVFGGDQGYFPEYVYGMYEKGETQLFITGGLGSDWKILPRFNNLPEIAVLRIS